MNTTTKAQRTNKRQDAIWEKAKRAQAETAAAAPEAPQTIEQHPGYESELAKIRQEARAAYLGVKTYCLNRYNVLSVPDAIRLRLTQGAHVNDDCQLRPLEKLQSIPADKTAHTPVYCQEIKYHDGDTLSVSAVKSKPRETICILLGYKRQRNELLEALKEARAILAPIVHKMNVRQHFSEKNILANVIDKAIAKAEGSAQ